MNRYFYYWVLISLAVISSPEILAQDQKKTEISVKAEINRAFITIGDPVEYSVGIRHSPDVQILSTIPPPPADIFKIKKVEDMNVRNETPYQTGKKFTLTSFRLGEFVLEPLRIQYRVGGGDPQTIETDRIYLSVKSVAEGETKEDIRGVKSVISMQGKTAQILLWLGLVALALLAFALYQRQARQKQAEKVEEPAMTPEEEALMRLNQLFDSDLIRNGKIKEYYFVLSEILRYYLERRFHILAVESTTSEILRSLKGRSLAPSLQEKIIEVLEAADLAKFAKWKPEPAQVAKLNQESKKIIEEARPQDTGVAHGV